LKSLVALLPAAACAALMFVCFRMMRHSGMPAGEPGAKDEVVALREEVAALREEVARTQPVPTGTTDSGIGQSVLTLDGGRTESREEVPR